jgi:hypothetical protein
MTVSSGGRPLSTPGDRQPPATPATVDALCGFATDDEVVVARRAIDTLGKVGRPDDRFEVNASEEPLDHPLTVTGTFDSENGRLRFEQAITDTRFSKRQQARRRQPRLVDRPDR